MKTVTEILIEARNLISEPERWTQIFYSRDALGYRTEWDSPTAVCWCSAGAIAKVVGATSGQSPMDNALFVRARAELRAATGSDNIQHFNDTHNHAEVMGMFDRAITKRQV